MKKASDRGISPGTPKVTSFSLATFNCDSSKFRDVVTINAETIMAFVTGDVIVFQEIYSKAIIEIFRKNDPIWTKFMVERYHPKDFEENSAKSNEYLVTFVDEDSRIGIESIQNEMVAGQSSWFRAPQAVLLSIGSIKLHLINVHMGRNKEAESDFENLAGTIKKLFQKNGYFIVVGDFNKRADDEFIKKFATAIGGVIASFEHSAASGPIDFAIYRGEGLIVVPYRDKFKSMLRDCKESLNHLPVRFTVQLEMKQ